MIELLVGTIIAFLITVPLLTFVVDILNRDVREQAKTNGEQDLQAAVDYIAQDISQAFYIYDPNDPGDSANNIPSYNEFINQLPFSDDNQRTPILVFWKREFVENSVPVNPGNLNINCPNNQNQCDDTFVHSLVVYYLVQDDNDTWCQPSGDTCPNRIARFQIQDGVKNALGNYVCDNDGDNDGRSSECDDDSDQRKFQRDLGYTSYDSSNPTTWTQAQGEEYENPSNVLVNYIEGFTLDSVNTNNNLAQITIIGNALRRSQNDFSCIEDASVTPPTYKDSPYCSKATAQVGARSGLGQ